MPIHLPDDLLASLRAEVLNGHFASEDEVVAEAVRQFLGRRQPSSPSPTSGSIGGMRGAAELIERMTEDIMHGRRTRILRLPPDE